MTQRRQYPLGETESIIEMRDQNRHSVISLMEEIMYSWTLAVHQLWTGTRWRGSENVVLAESIDIDWMQLIDLRGKFAAEFVPDQQLNHAIRHPHTSSGRTHPFLRAQTSAATQSPRHQGVSPPPARWDQLLGPRSEKRRYPAKPSIIGISEH
ncbi:hypothetical protein BP6252_08983 [Coleophoma cylindrospora]|uniref:Uncharacterized protein n=1 Tax=Coleophoma cylindrospora TaxID=1849047 RepID=A0A3D8R0M2_9HELO|nr:hypothetical protein BP6252_08983 [Coleophoma cylindrospora]